MSASTSKNYFDLPEYIRTFAQTEVAAQMAQGLAWRIDTMLQQASRQLFKHVREDQYRKGVDGLAELSTALAEAHFAEVAFEEAGSATTGPVTSIGELMHVREAAHNLAAELTALTTDFNGRPKHYEIPDLDNVFHAPVTLKLKNETRRRLTSTTERRAKAFGLTPDETKAQVNKKIERKESQLLDIGATLLDQSGAVYEMFRIGAARHAAEPGVERNFWTIDITTQRALIEHTIASADRAEDYATDNSSLTDSEFDDISMSVLKVNKDLRAVLASQRFVDADRIAA